MGAVSPLFSCGFAGAWRGFVSHNRAKESIMVDFLLRRGAALGYFGQVSSGDAACAQGRRSNRPGKLSGKRTALTYALWREAIGPPKG